MMPLSCEQARQIDRIAIDQYKIPGILLMENAGRGAAEVIHQFAPTGLVTILSGKGNNGGDGYVVARHLQLLGHEVHIVSVCAIEQLSGDARINAEIAKHADIPIRFVDDPSENVFAFDTSTVIVDGLLGTGSRPPLRGVYAELVQAANQCQCMRFALDIPTGMDGDTGEASDPTFKADHTLTFVAEKIGFANPSAAALLGQLHVISIGVPRKLLSDIV